MNDLRQDAPHHGADRAPGVDFVAAYRDAYVKANSIPAELCETFPRLGCILLIKATADRVRQHPNGKFTRAHDQRSLRSRDDDHVNGASETCPERALTK